MLVESEIANKWLWRQTECWVRYIGPLRLVGKIDHMCIIDILNGACSTMTPAKVE